MAQNRPRRRPRTRHLKHAVTAVCLLGLGLVGCKHPPPKATASPTPQASDSPTVWHGGRHAADATGSGAASPQIETLGPLDAALGARRVFAYYEPGFQTAPSYGGWQGPGHDSAVVRDDGTRDSATAFHPEIGLYDTRDSAVLGYQLLLLAGGGFDGLVVRWGGRHTAAEAGLQALFKQVRAWDDRYGMRLGLMVLIDAATYAPLAPPARAGVLRAEVTHLLAGVGAAPAYQRLKGQPVLFFRPRSGPNGTPVISRRTWARARLGTGAAFRSAIQDPDRWPGAPDPRDAELPFTWLAPGAEPDDDGTQTLDWFYQSFAARRTRGPLDQLIGTTYPGQQAPGLPAIARTLQGQSTLVRTWQHGLDYAKAHPEAPPGWMQTISWNDWAAGTQIEPSLERGSSDYETAASQNERFTGQHNAPTDALALARRYLEARRTGTPEQAFAEALERFFAGETAEALAVMPKAKTP